MARSDRRRADQLRPITLTRRPLKFAKGSCHVEWGDTKVLCAASVEERVPPFLRDKGQGWVTAEYSMLPGSSRERIAREAARGKLGGRTHEIQRLIGRSLRAVVDLERLGERTIWIDCDVVQADGGTRCAAITGSFVALVECLRALRRSGKLHEMPIRDFVAAASVGMVEATPKLDLTYEEDVRAGVDMNVVVTGQGQLIEVQGTAEHQPFSVQDLQKLVRLATRATKVLVALQRKVLGVRHVRDL